MMYLENYKILLPKLSDSVLQFAAKELQTMVCNATKIKLDIITVLSDNTYNYFSIDNTELYKQNFNYFTYDENNTSAYEIRTVNGNYIIKGYTSYGSLYGVYELLKLLFCIEFIASDEIYNPSLSEVEFKEINLIDIPDIEFRHISFYNILTNSASANRFRSLSSNMSMKTIDKTVKYDAIDGEVYYNMWGGMFSHTMLYTLPIEYDSNNNVVHKDWYCETLNQLCLTNEVAKKQYIVNLKHQIQKYPQSHFFMLGIMDNGDYCKCEHCMSAYKKYGSPSAVHILFINDVAKQIQQWQQEALPDSSFLLCAFAYNWTKNPPVEYSNKLNKFVAMNKQFILNDNVAIMIAPLDACALHSINCNCNKLVKNRFDAWGALTKNIIVWDYHEFYNNYFIFMPSINSYKDNILFYIKHGAKYVYAEGNVYGVSTGFQELKSYLLANLMWKSNQNVDELIDNFFVKYYKQTSKHMHKYYKLLCDNYIRLEQLYATLGERGYHTAFDTKDQPDVLTQVHWPKELLLECEKILEQALEVAKSETKPYCREKLMRRVKIEMLMIKYLIIELHTYYCSKNLVDARIEEFKKCIDDCQIVRYCHWGSLIKACNPAWLIDGKINEWRYRFPARSEN